MTNPLSVAAILTGLILLAVFIFLVRPFDPVVILCRWLYAGRRAVYILGTMLWDAPSEARYWWVTQRPSDSEALADLEKQYPAGEEREAAR